MNETLFWIIASLMVPAALAVVWAPSVLYAALGLLSVFLLMAALFLLQQAYFLAVSQVMVYAVGLVIVFLFGLMLTGNTLGTGSLPRTTGFKALLGLASAALVTFLVVLAPLLGSALAPANTVPTLATIASVETLGTLLLSRYALPFEVVSILLLMAMVGAIVLAKKPDPPTLPPTPLETTTTGEGV